MGLHVCGGLDDRPTEYKTLVTDPDGPATGEVSVGCGRGGLARSVRGQMPCLWHRKKSGLHIVVIRI